MILLFEALCLALAYSAFCRTVHVNPHVMFRIRAAITLVGAAAFVGMMLPLYGWEPDWFHCALVFVMWAYLTAFAKTWKTLSGPPERFLKQSHDT